MTRAVALSGGEPRETLVREADGAEITMLVDNYAGSARAVGLDRPPKVRPR